MPEPSPAQSQVISDLATHHESVQVGKLADDSSVTVVLQVTCPEYIEHGHHRHTRGREPSDDGCTACHGDMMIADPLYPPIRILEDGKVTNGMPSVETVADRLKVIIWGSELQMTDATWRELLQDAKELVA